MGSVPYIQLYLYRRSHFLFSSQGEQRQRWHRVEGEAGARFQPRCESFWQGAQNGGTEPRGVELERTFEMKGCSLCPSLGGNRAEEGDVASKGRHIEFLPGQVKLGGDVAFRDPRKPGSWWLYIEVG